MKIEWQPLLVTLTGAGLLLIGLADEQARIDGPLSLPFFWAGLAFMVAPSAWRLYGTQSARSERLSIVLLLGLSLFVVKVMASPLTLTLPDEFSHWRTVNDILTTGHLLAPNPLLPINSVYPGMEAGTAAAEATSGIGIFPLATFLLAAARLVSLLSFFLLAETISHSARVAGLASVIYMSNTSFLVFDAQFAYESLALPLGFLVIWAVTRWSRSSGRSIRYGVLAVMGITAIATTHHLTSFVLVAFLCAWLAASVIRPGGEARLPIAIAAGWALAINAAWLVTVGGPAIDYLSGVAQAGVEESLAILMGASSGRQLFVPRAGFASPLAEIVVAYGAVAVVGLALPFLVLHAIRGRRPPAIVLTLAVAAALYPGSIALRFTAAGFEASQRAAEFLFAAIGILGADFLVGLRPSRWRPGKSLIVLPLVLVVFAGGMISGNPPQGRLPGPYHVAAEQRSIEPLGIDTAIWASRELGPGNRLIADRTNSKLMATYGAQFPVRSAGTPQVMFAPAIGHLELDILRRAGIRYVVVDLRLTRALPVVSVYFDITEPDTGQHLTPMPLSALEKFDGLPGVARIYDSGDIIIYDMQGLVDATP